MEELKFNSAILIRFKKMESDRYINNYILPNFHKYLDVDDDLYIAVEEDSSGCDNMVLFIEKNKVDELIKFCSEEDIIKTIPRDISEGLLLGTIKEEVILKMMTSDEFKAMFNMFLRKNLTVDIILDKINRFGEESLTEIDKEILASEE